MRSPHAFVWFALTAVACGGPQTNGNGSSGRSVPEVVVQEPAPTVQQYSTSPSEGELVLGRLATGAVRRGIEQAGSEHNQALQGDARLGQLAAWVAERLSDSGDPPPAVVLDFFTRHLGLVEPVPHITVLGESPDQLEAAVHNSVSTFLERQSYSHFGAAVVARGNMHVAVVMLSWRWLELEPVPRYVPTGQTLTMRGRLIGQHRNPTIVVADPDGSVRRMPAGGGPDFDVRVPVASDGVYRVEMVGRGEHGETVIANFPVYVGQSIPTEVRVSVGSAGPEEDVQTVELRLLELLNEARRDASLSELSTHEGVRSVAMGHSRDMAQAGFIGHRSPTTGTAADRLQAARLHSGLILENIGRGYSAEEIHRGLLGSPGHRANLLNPSVTHVGIGVVAEPEGGRTAFIATQLFVRIADRIDVGAAPAELLSMINQTRAARGAAPLSAEDHLSTAAQEAAERYFADPELTQQDTVDDASASLRRFAIAYRRIGGVMAIVSGLSEAARLEPTLDGDVRQVGIGVAQGTRPDSEPNAIAVVIVLAWPRE